MRRLILGLAAVLIVLGLFYAFTEPSITGMQVMSTRLLIVERVTSMCNISLVEGWNMVSFYCMGLDLPVEELLMNMEGEYESIRTYDASDALDPWKSYNPDLPSWAVQDLPYVARSDGYWILVGEDQRFVRAGNLYTPTIIDLHTGWNLIGYPSTNVSLVNDTFNTTVPLFDYVESFNSSDYSDPWKEWTWNSSLVSDQDLNYTVPGSGFWIFMLENSSVRIT
jgi:hypothetical protein